MRKILSSKKCSQSCTCQDDENRKFVRSRKPSKQSKKQPKPHVHPIGNQRNDSSNVSAVLNPEDYHQSPRNPYTITSKCYRPQEEDPKGAFKKCCLGENTCYCKELKKIKPTLISRPNKCLAAEDDNWLSDGGFRRCLCMNTDLIRQHQEDLSSSLKHSRQRDDYDRFREQQKEGEAEKREKEEEEGGDSISTLLGTNKADSQTASSGIGSLSQFRKDHYFDTHSTDDLSRDVPDHTCVHQYKLDDRLLPEATNVDSYGRSRCSVCSSTKDGSFPCTDYSCREVCICDGESQVEVKLDRNDLERFGGFVGRFRRPDYFNTLALRQQKMLRHRRRFGGTISDVYY